MTPAETADILRQFNEWRRGDEDIPQFDPREIGEAIDAAVGMIEMVDAMESQPCPATRDHNWYYAQGWNDCLTAVTEKSK